MIDKRLFFTEKFIPPFSMMSLLEQKIFLALTSKYYQYSFEENQDHRYYLTTGEYARAIRSTKDGNNRRFDSVCKSIRNKGLITRSALQQDENETTKPEPKEFFLKRSRYLKEQQRLQNGEKGFVVEFNPLFAMYCDLIKKRYDKHIIDQFILFDSKYAFPFIEMIFNAIAALHQKKKPKEKNDELLKIVFSIDQLRIELAIVNKYALYQDLKTRVIKPALSQLGLIQDKMDFRIIVDPESDKDSLVLLINQLKRPL